MTTTKLPSSEGELVYQQTMLLAGQESSMYMSFANVGPMAVFGLALPFANSTIPVKASLPQTFLDIVGKPPTGSGRPDRENCPPTRSL